MTDETCKLMIPQQYNNRSKVLLKISDDEYDDGAQIV
jgi:hypothetical protein